MGCTGCDATDQILYRANEKGVKGIWKCESCLGKEPPADVKQICEDIQSAIHEIGDGSYG